MEIEHPALVFLQKTFCNRIDADEKLNDPEQTVPYRRIRSFHRICQHKNGSANVQQHSIKAVLLPQFQQNVFLKKNRYLFYRINNKRFTAKLLIHLTLPAIL